MSHELKPQTKLNHRNVNNKSQKLGTNTHIRQYYKDDYSKKRKVLKDKARKEKQSKRTEKKRD